MYSWGPAEPCYIQNCVIKRLRCIFIWDKVWVDYRLTFGQILQNFD